MPCHDVADRLGGISVPIGPAFDIDRMLSAHRAGTPLSELITRAWALSGPPLPHPLELLAAAAV